MQFLSSAFGALQSRSDDDFIDRLNYYYTPSLLLVFGVLQSASQWEGDPIECWVPREFIRAWEEYAENYCFVQNTYWISVKDRIPTDVEVRVEKKLSYYQWVPFILALLALCFHTPYLMWRLLNWQTGINIQAISDEAVTNTTKKGEDREKHLNSIATFITGTLKAQRETGNHSFCAPSVAQARHYGHYVTILYISSKLLYILNALLQILVLNIIFGTGTSDWGFSIFVNMFRGVVWELTGIFPRVTFCDFEVRVLGNIHRYTIQCVLPINMVNEKIFLFLWFWCFFLVALNLWNFSYWLRITVTQEERIKFVRKYVCPVVEDESDEKLQQRFTLRFLRLDGVLILRKIRNHAGNLVTAKITRKLFEQYRDDKKAHPLGGGKMSVDMGLNPALLLPTPPAPPESSWKQFWKFRTVEDDDDTTTNTSGGGSATPRTPSKEYPKAFPYKEGQF